MPYKDKTKRYESTCRTRAKKPELYKYLDRKKEIARCQRLYHIHRRYGLTPTDYRSLAEKQNGQCAICHVIPPPTKTGRNGLWVDHNHTTNVVRGLLCARCNTFIGFIETAGRGVLLEIEKYLENNS